MKVALICFSLTGQQTGERLCRGLEAAGMTAELDKKSKYLLDSIQISTSAWAGEKFLCFRCTDLYRCHRNCRPQHCALCSVKEVRPCGAGRR